MNVLMISGDPNLLKEGTEAHARFQLQKTAVEQLDVFVWPQVHSWREIFHAARENTYDVVTAQDPFWRGLLAWRLARHAGAKLNIQVHTDLAAQSFARYVLAQIVLRHSDSIRVVSQKLKMQVEMIKVSAPIRILPIYVDLKRFHSLTHQPQKNKKTILWIGRFEEEKDPEEMIPLFEKVRQAKIDASLVLLGAGSLEGQLRLKSAHQLEYRDEIEFPGWKDPISYIAMADVVVSTSKHEGWGASMIEALAAGVPVVAPDVGVAKEAGALVVAREKLAETVIDVLKQGKRGELKLTLIEDPQAWAKRWCETLV